MVAGRAPPICVLPEVPEERIKESFGVPLGIVQVRRNADADEDVLGGEPGGEVFGGFGTEPKTNHVLDAYRCWDRFYTEPLRLRFDEVREIPDLLGDVLDAPGQDLAERRDSHREQHKVAPLADVEAPGARLEGVLILDESREVLAAGAVDPVVLYRFPFPPPLAGIQKTEPVRPEQPLVRRG